MTVRLRWRFAALMARVREGLEPRRIEGERPRRCGSAGSHPDFGASGGRVLVTLLHALKRHNNATRSLAVLGRCNAVALIVDGV